MNIAKVHRSIPEEFSPLGACEEKKIQYENKKKPWINLQQEDKHKIKNGTLYYYMMI
jgi:hypothetical protein